MISDSERYKLAMARQRIEPHLQAIKMCLPPEYKITLVMRHTNVDENQMVLTEEADKLEEVANAVLRAEVMPNE